LNRRGSFVKDPEWRGNTWKLEESTVWGGDSSKDVAKEVSEINWLGKDEEWSGS